MNYGKELTKYMGGGIRRSFLPYQESGASENWPERGYGKELTKYMDGMQRGGMVPGEGRGDKVPTLLEPGELVVPRDKVSNVLNQYPELAKTPSQEKGFGRQRPRYEGLGRMEGDRPPSPSAWEEQYIRAKEMEEDRVEQTLRKKYENVRRMKSHFGDTSSDLKWPMMKGMQEGGVVTEEMARVGKQRPYIGEGEFNKAFADAKAAGKKTFTWDGRLYKTEEGVVGKQRSYIGEGEFNESLANAEAEGKKNFTWDGRLYPTETAEKAEGDRKRWDPKNDGGFDRSGRWENGRYVEGSYSGPGPQPVGVSEQHPGSVNETRRVYEAALNYPVEEGYSKNSPITKEAWRHVDPLNIYQHMRGWGDRNYIEDYLYGVPEQYKIRNEGGVWTESKVPEMQEGGIVPNGGRSSWMEQNMQKYRDNHRNKYSNPYSMQEGGVVPNPQKRTRMDYATSADIYPPNKELFRKMQKEHTGNLDNFDREFLARKIMRGVEGLVVNEQPNLSAGDTKVVDEALNRWKNQVSDPNQFDALLNNMRDAYQTRGQDANPDDRWRTWHTAYDDMETFLGDNHLYTRPTSLDASLRGTEPNWNWPMEHEDYPRR